VALAGACVTAPSLAKEPAEPTHFELRAPAGCSSWEDFSSRVQQRSARILLTARPAARSLLVEIREQGPALFRGTVRVVERRGAARSRQLKASSCAEVVDALSLIATVTLDPDALLAEPEPEPKAKPEPTPEPPPPVATKPAAPAAKPAPQPRETPGASESGEPFRLSVGGAALLLVNQAPEVAPGGALSVALELRPGHVVSPFLRLSLVHAQRRNVPEALGYANFAFTLPTLDVCPLRIGPRAFGVRPCASASLGLLQVWGAAAAAGESHARLSGFAGASLWAGLRVSEVLEIVADGRAGAALWRDRYGFDNEPFFRTPSLGISAGLGVAGGFP
jgi:hypothetical protein